MMKHVWFLILAVCAMWLVGCAGAVAPFIHNPYAGTYNGSFTASDGRSGPATVTLTNIGNVFGTLTDSASGESGDLRGSVSTSGTFGGSVSFGGQTHNLSGDFKSSNGSASTTLSGSDGYTLNLQLSSS